MDKKKIIVFWDNKGIAKALKENKEFIVCGSQNEFNGLSKKALKEARGFLVLCELNWNFEKEEKPNIDRVEFGGIRLVQRFIRDKMNLKAPVVFTSNDTAKNICEANPENKIIRTPALKHFFVDILSLDNPVEDLYHCFDLLENVTMTDTELAYTKLLYCDMKGLLIQINHVLEGRSKAEQDKYRKDIEYVLKEQFHNDEVLMEQYRKAKDLSDFCKTLIARFEATDTRQVYDGFLHEKNHKTIRILLLEDELEKDNNVERFVNYIKDLEQEAAAEGTKPLFQITVEKNTDDIAYDPQHDPLASERKHSMVEFDVFISDIEIWDNDGDLVTLGFNVVEAMARESKRPLYYIVTNVSRSFYDQIKIPYVRRIRLKKEVFGTKESIETFLYGIKEVFDNREAEAAEKEYKCETLFNTMEAFIKKKETFSQPKQFGKPFTEEGAPLIPIHSYDDIENDIIKVKSQQLIEYFMSLFKANRFENPQGGAQNLKVYNTNCSKMREYIKSTIGLGNGNLDKIVAKRMKNNQDPSDEDISNFVVRLVLRRFFLYVRWFVEQCGVMQSFEKIRRTRSFEEFNKRKKFTINDIACRAISDQHKTLTRKDDEGEMIEGKPQTHCLDDTLLFAIRDTLRLTDKEDAFVSGLKQQELNWSSITKQ